MANIHWVAIRLVLRLGEMLTIISEELRAPKHKLAALLHKAGMSKESLINSDFPAAQGCVAIISDYKSLIM